MDRPVRYSFSCRHSHTAERSCSDGNNHHFFESSCQKKRDECHFNTEQLLASLGLYFTTAERVITVQFSVSVLLLSMCLTCFSAVCRSYRFWSRWTRSSMGIDRRNRPDLLICSRGAGAAERSGWKEPSEESRLVSPTLKTT